MKRMHLQLLKKANCVLASLLMLLGFSCTDDEGEGPIIWNMALLTPIFR